MNDDKEFYEKHKIYEHVCLDCGFRAFGAPVFVHELKLGHRMVPEYELDKISLEKLEKEKGKE